MAGRRVLSSSVILLSFLLLASYLVNLNSLNPVGNTHVYNWERFSSTEAKYLVKLQFISTRYPMRTGGHFVIVVCKRFLKSRVAYYSNCTASFSPAAVTLVRSGDIHPQPGPIRQRNESAKLDIPQALKANVKLAHLNVRSLKARENFCLVKDTVLQNGFDIFTISETWADLTVSDASLEIPGYQLFRQDRGQHKAGGGLCIYAKSNLKITVLEDLSSACDDGFQQLWLKVQCRSFKSFLICNTYRPPQTPTTCFESLSNSLTDALLLDLDIFVLGDLNCNLLGSSPEVILYQRLIYIN